MEKQQCNPLQNFDDSKTEILKRRLMKTSNISSAANLAQNSTQQNVMLNTLRSSISSSMIVSSVQAPQCSMPITHNLMTPVKIHPSNGPYPLQLSTVHVPVQIPGSTSNINVPVQFSGNTSTVPLQIAPTVSLPLQVSGSTSVPVQLTAGDTISVPLQIPTASQNIQLTSAGLSSMPLLQTTSQPLSSIIHVHMGSNARTNLDGASELGVPNNSQIQMSDGVQVKMGNPNAGGQVQVGPSSTMVQIPNSSNSSIQLALPNSGHSGNVLRGAQRQVPHVVYIQTPSGLKPVTNTDVITQASSSGNPPQIIVRRPVTSSANIHLISNVTTKSNITPRMSVANKSSLLAPSNAQQPIVIQKAKNTDKMVVPVSISAGGANKQAIAYLGPVKKSTNKTPENQSLLIPNTVPNQNNSNQNQKLFLTPMNMQKIPNTKFILPVTMPASMSSKGPIINLQIANGQIQNDPAGSITVMRDTASQEMNDMPPLQPLGKVSNGKEGGVPRSPKEDKSFAVSITGSRAESTGEQEYSLSIPETNASMNDDIYTVSIADEDGRQREKSFTLAIPEKGKSLLNKNMIERHEVTAVTIPAPAILRRSYSDNSERKTNNANLKRRISLCNENLQPLKFRSILPKPNDKPEGLQEIDNNDDHRVPSLFCDEKLEKDLDPKVNLPDSDAEDYKESRKEVATDQTNSDYQYFIKTVAEKNEATPLKRESVDSALEEDPPGLMWNNGVGQLQGSALQFQTNEFGLIDLIDNSDHDENFSLSHSTKYHTPLKQRIDRSGREKKPTSPEDLYRCDGCGCHGMAAEFITPNFCSMTCQSQVQKVQQKKRERERLEMSKKKNKMKRLLGKKQSSDTDISVETKEEKVSLKHSDPMPPDVRIPEEATENERYPWMCGKNGFSWMRYLEFCKAKAAPVKLFKDPFPYNKNGFKVSMRLEAIDPQNASVFSVVSVAEVQGYRMRLHFDEYPDLYDYWVNADCIDIFPPGWCEKNGRTLKPPLNYNALNFSWPLYLKQMRAVAAPKHLFPHLTNVTVKPNGFRVGMKLEAEDRKNNMVCAATITDIMDNRMLINFDSWDEMYDYWVDPTSPYIHPVGWAQERGISLTPPNFIKEPESFSWESYLAESGSTAAPARAFKTRPPHPYREGMKLEVVDPRVQFLIRVATVREVNGHQLHISFDGWPDSLSTWMDDDSPDIHPVGWCLKTGHPLEPPLTEEELETAGPCGVGGCRGLGAVRGGSLKTHAAASACPYRSAEPPRPNRLAHDRPQPRPPKSTHTSTPTSDTVREKPQRGRPPKHKRVEVVSKNELGSDDESISSSASKRVRPSLTAHEVEAAVLSEYDARQAPRRTSRTTPAASVRHLVQQLGLHDSPLKWTNKEVCMLVSAVGGAEAGAGVRAAQLCGEQLLAVSREELVDCARLRLGPAIKVYAAVLTLRQNVS